MSPGVNPSSRIIHTEKSTGLVTYTCSISEEKQASPPNVALKTWLLFGNISHVCLGPPVLPFYLFLGEGSPTKIHYCSNLSTGGPSLLRFHVNGEQVPLNDFRAAAWILEATFRRKNALTSRILHSYSPGLEKTPGAAVSSQSYPPVGFTPQKGGLEPKKGVWDPNRVAMLGFHVL